MYRFWQWQRRSCIQSSRCWSQSGRSWIMFQQDLAQMKPWERAKGGGGVGWGGLRGAKEREWRAKEERVSKGTRWRRGIHKRLHLEEKYYSHTCSHAQIPVKLEDDLGNQMRLWAMCVWMWLCVCVHVCPHLAFSILTGYVKPRGERGMGLSCSTCVWNKKSIQAVDVWPPTDWAAIFTPSSLGEGRSSALHFTTFSTRCEVQPQSFWIISGTFKLKVVGYTGHILCESGFTAGWSLLPQTSQAIVCAFILYFLCCVLVQKQTSAWLSAHIACEHDIFSRIFVSVIFLLISYSTLSQYLNLIHL